MTGVVPDTRRRRVAVGLLGAITDIAVALAWLSAVARFVVHLGWTRPNRAVSGSGHDPLSAGTPPVPADDA